MHKSLLSLLASLLVLALPARAAVETEIALAPGGYRWLEEGTGDGPLYMVISVEKQRVHVYSGDRLIGVASVSTGMKGHRTPTGDYPILQKRQWHRSNLYSNAPMPFMQRRPGTGSRSMPGIIRAIRPAMAASVCPMPSRGNYLR
jgi:hypothetical protein